MIDDTVRDLQNMFDQPTMADRVADLLRSEIQRGVLAPGMRLRQADLADRFGVSTTPVREAFMKLQTEGLLHIEPRRGATVLKSTFEDLRECFEIRELLEGLAISKAIPYLTPAMLDELQEIVEKMKKTEDDQRWVELNNQFHLGLYAAAGLPRLHAIISSLRDASDAYLHMFAKARRASRSKDEEHQAILDACRDKDPICAAELVRMHLRRPIRELFEKLSGGSDDPTASLDLPYLSGDRAPEVDGD